MSRKRLGVTTVPKFPLSSVFSSSVTSSSSPFPGINSCIMVSYNIFLDVGGSGEGAASSLFFSIEAFSPCIYGLSSVLLAKDRGKAAPCSNLPCRSLLVVGIRDRRCPFFPSDIVLAKLTTHLNPLFI